MNPPKGPVERQVSASHRPTAVADARKGVVPVRRCRAHQAMPAQAFLPGAGADEVVGAADVDSAVFADEPVWLFDAVAGVGTDVVGLPQPAVVVDGSCCWA